MLPKSWCARGLVFLTLALCGLSPLNAQDLGLGLGLTSGGRAPAEQLPSYPADPRESGANQIWVATAYTDTLWQESSGGGQGTTHAAADGDPVARIDTVVGPHHLYCGTGTTDRPKLASDASRYSSLWFTRSSSQKIDVYNSKSSFRNLHEGVFSIFFYVKFASNGTRQYLVANCDSVSSGNYGFRLFKNSDNTFWFDMFGGGAATYVKQFNVPSTTLNDTNWHSILVTCSGVPGTLTFQLDNATPQTTSVTATNLTATGQDAANDLRLGSDFATGSYYFDGYMSDLVIANTVLTSDQVTALKAYNPSRSSASLVRYTALTITNPATQISPPPYIWYDFSDTTGMYKTNDTSTAVTADGDSIGRIESKGGAPLGRHASQATANRRPTYKTNIHNGKSAGLWVGASGTGGVSQDLAFTAWPKGAQTFILVCENTVPGTGSPGYPGGGLSHEGSHWLSHGVGVAGYLGNSGIHSTNGTTPNRLFQHLGGSANISMNQIGETMATQGPHLIEYTRNGTSHNLWYDGIEVDPSIIASQINGVNSKTALTSSQTWAPTHMGEPAITGTDGVSSWWDIGGYVDELIVANAAYTPTLRRKVRSYAATKYGLTWVSLADDRKVSTVEFIAAHRRRPAWFNQLHANAGTDAGAR